MSGSFIFVRCLLKAHASIEVLTKHRVALERQQHKRPSAARSALLDALWDGIWELMREAARCAAEAHERGQLLYCWQGAKLPRDVELAA
jgi:hypothetical protein